VKRAQYELTMTSVYAEVMGASPVKEGKMSKIRRELVNMNVLFYSRNGSGIISLNIFTSNR
jgi:hypothetical protein